MLIEISDTVRVEDAPPRKRAKATEALLSDTVTAKHYQAGMPDALGNEIVLGEPMDYIDWRCSEEERVWNVYQLIEVKDPQTGETTNRFLPVSSHPTQEEAEIAAKAL
jgi:hypothetical protein